MKTNGSPSRDAQGSVLVITLSVVVVAAIVLASYLLIVQAQTASVARSQSWNTLISVSEAGVEEAMSLINKGAPFIGNPWAWTNSATSDGWTQNGSTFTMTRTLYNNNSYTVTIDISGYPNPPVHTCVATVPYTSIPWVFSSAGGPFLAAGGVTASNGTGTVGRQLQIQTALNSLFNAAVVTKSNFNMNGNNSTIDSFDSSNPLYSTAGQYDPTKAKANGILATDSSIIGDLSLGNGNIYGKVYTGPGTAVSSVQIGANGAVGTAAWNNGGGTGIQPGAWSGDFNLTIPDVPTPTLTGVLPLPGAVSKVITIPGGTYIAAVDPGASTYAVTAPTTLWVQSSFSLNKSGVIITNGGSLTLYVGTANGSGDKLDLGGGAFINQAGYAQNMQFYGLPSLNTITFSGNASFVGTIYAPEADMTGNGGGGNPLDTMGAMIVKSATLNGHWNFHYDEHLTNAGPARGWVARQWTEQKWTGH